MYSSMYMSMPVSQFIPLSSLPLVSIRLFSISVILLGAPTFFFLPYHAACRIVVSWPEIEPALPAVEVQSLNHWTTREVSKYPYSWVNLDSYVDLQPDAQVSHTSLVSVL